MIRTHRITQSEAAKASGLAAKHSGVVAIASAMTPRPFMSFAQTISLLASEGVTQ